MRAKLLAAAVVAALVAPAADAALRLSHRGTGDALYLPFYTVEDGQVTLVTVSNRNDEAKAVRINFNEAWNGQRVLSLNVYLGPRDSWSGAIIADGPADSAPARLVTTDTSCTGTDGLADDLVFRDFAYADTHADGGPTGLARTREGAIEVIEMGVVGGALGDAIDDMDCEAVADARKPGGAWSQNPNVGISAPTGGISASADIVDIAEGLAYSMRAVAIDGFGERPHHTIASADFPRLIAPVAAVGGGDFEVQLPDGGLVTVEGDRPADAVSALFMTASLHGDFHFEESLAADTEWVVSFPTKSAYVFPVPGALVTAAGTVAAPFSDAFGEGGACEGFTTQWSDMDGDPAMAFSNPVGASICAQTQRVLLDPGSSTVTGFDGQAGRMRILFGGTRPPLVVGSAGGDLAIHGLPAIGFRVSRYVNGQVQPGVLANYASSIPLDSTPPLIDPDA